MEKIRIIILLLMSSLLLSCKDDMENEIEYPIPGVTLWTPPVQYVYDGENWTIIEDKEIDVTNMPEEFVLNLRSVGIYETAVSDYNSKCSIKLIDPLWDESGKMRDPVMYLDGVRIYSQRVSVDMHGEKRVNVSLDCNLRKCHFTLVHK